MEYTELVYDILKKDYEGLDSVYEDYIIHCIGTHGLIALQKAGYLETCGVMNGRQLYVLCEKGE